jgi:uncharacterized protein (TIGR03067 family)
MTRLFAAAVVAFGLSAVTADDKSAKDELARFAGTWKGVSVVQDGKEVPKAEAVRLTVAGEKYTLKAGGEDIEGTHKLDPTKTPKQIEAVRAKGPHAGEKMLGIYELDGDTFKVCFAAPGKDRPTEFKSAAGSGRRLLVLLREKP